jgi:hypothetical protein
LNALIAIAVFFEFEVCVAEVEKDFRRAWFELD